MAPLAPAESRRRLNQQKSYKDRNCFDRCNPESGQFYEAEISLRKPLTCELEVNINVYANHLMTDRIASWHLSLWVRW
jgi:hypothetical protein